MFSTIIIFLHCVSKNDTGLARYNSDDHQLILVIFGRERNVAERLSYQMLVCFPTTSNLRLCTTWGDMNQTIVSFSHKHCILLYLQTHIFKLSLGYSWTTLYLRNSVNASCCQNSLWKPDILSFSNTADQRMVHTTQFSCCSAKLYFS